MKIVLDGFGGDSAPKEVIKACAVAQKELGVSMAITGNEKEIKKAAAENNISLEGIEIIDAELSIPVEAEPKSILKEYKESSMAAGLEMIAEKKADAFISAGSTGALVFGATFIVKRIKGVKRPVIATTIPCTSGFYTLVDSGANSEARPEMLVQFAKMGEAFLKATQGIKNPRVGLVNIGSEETKGDELRTEAYKLLKDSDLNFIGNTEARDLPFGVCDLAICDGFTGNIVLKLTEGMASFFTEALKKIFYTNALTKAAAIAIKKPFKAFKKKLDYKEIGGVPILGIDGIVIKAHGASDEKAFLSAIKQASLCVENKMVEKIEKCLAD